MRDILIAAALFAAACANPAQAEEPPAACLDPAYAGDTQMKAACAAWRKDDAQVAFLNAEIVRLCNKHAAEEFIEPPPLK